jgi:hypothetical protein
MGWIRHHGIIVTGMVDDDFSKDYTWNIQKAHDKAVELRLPVSNVIKGCTNGYASIFIAPDGSKEGWATSDVFDERRKLFVEWLQSEGRGLDWFEYSDDTDGDRLEFTASSTKVAHD